jgi:hypothetical protein
MKTFVIPIYLRKSGSDKVKLNSIAELTQETANQVIFLSQEYLSVDLDSHYYVKRKGLEGKPELWLIEFRADIEPEPPHTYTARVIEKFRDVSEDWISDE